MMTDEAPRTPRHGSALLLLRVVLAAGLVVAPSCGGDEEGAPTTTQASSASPSTDTSEATTPSAPGTPTVAGEPGSTTTATAEADTLEDGEHVVYLSAIDEGAATLTFNLVELLTGQEAVDAYLEDTGQPLDGEQFYLRDRNDLLRTLPVDPDAGPYSIIDAESCCDPIEVGFAGLVAVRDQAEAAGGVDAPFTITVHGGEVTSAVQLYLP